MSQYLNGQFGLATTEDAGALAPAVVTERGVAALHLVLGDAAPSSVRGLLADWDAWCDRIAAALPSVPDGAWVPARDVAFAAPLPDPTNLYLAGANYYDHVKEMGGPSPDKATDSAFHFMLPSASLIGTAHDVLRPLQIEKLDWEVELAVVIGRRADRVSPSEALDHVAGYAVANDVSVRDEAMFHPVFGVRFLFAKGQATLTPMGPVLVPARFVPDPGQLALTLSVNGERRQESNTAQMIWSVQEQIAFLSSQAPLLPGDVLLTGTPAGTAASHGAYLTDGDVMTASVEGLGELVNRVVGAAG